MSHVKVPCPECSQPCSKGVARCWSCRVRRDKKLALERHACPKCGQPRHETSSALCITCTRKERAVVPICVDCRGPTADPRKKRCRPCLNIARRKGIVRVGPDLLDNFVPSAFDALLNRPDLEWTAAELARRSGIAEQTICRWRSGAVFPRRVEWHIVAEFLALEPCRRCGGSGTTDPTEAEVDAITRAVQGRTLTVLPEPDLLVTGDGWTLDTNKRLLRVGDAQLRTTRQETQLIALLAQAGGRYRGAVPLGQALKTREQAPRTYISRLREKCHVAGIDLDRVIENGCGTGYRAVMATRTEASA